MIRYVYRLRTGAGYPFVVKVAPEMFIGVGLDAGVYRLEYAPHAARSLEDVVDVLPPKIRPQVITDGEYNAALHDYLMALEKV